MTGAASGTGLWDDTDAFYYDQLCMPTAPISPMRVRSMVGLIPLFAVAVVEGELAQSAGLGERMHYFHEQRSDLAPLSRAGTIPAPGTAAAVSGPLFR